MQIDAEKWMRLRRQEKAARDLAEAREDVLQAALEAVNQAPEHGMPILRAAVDDWKKASAAFLASLQIEGVKVVHTETLGDPDLLTGHVAPCTWRGPGDPCQCPFDRKGGGEHGEDEEA